MANESPSTQLGLYQALAQVQGSLPNFKKDAKGNFGKYITLDNIMEKTLPILTKQGLVWVTRPSINEQGEPTLKYGLYHTSGENLEGEMKLLLSKEDPQGQGSSITYARRYSICSVLGITADDDDDGTAASGGTTRTTSTTKRYPARTADVEAPARDVNADMLPLSKETKLFLAQALERSHGVTSMDAIKEKLNSLAQSNFQADIGNLTEDQGLQLLNIINKAAKGAI